MDQECAPTQPQKHHVVLSLHQWKGLSYGMQNIVCAPSVLHKCLSPGSLMVTAGSAVSSGRLAAWHLDVQHGQGAPLNRPFPTEKWQGAVPVTKHSIPACFLIIRYSIYLQDQCYSCSTPVTYRRTFSKRRCGN